MSAPESKKQSTPKQSTPKQSTSDGAPQTKESKDASGNRFDFQIMEPAGEEPFAAKALRKVKQNPFIPLGFLATVAFLGNGIRQFTKGDSVKQNKMMWGRIGAQGFTVFAFIAGAFYSQVPTIRAEAEKRRQERAKASSSE